MEKYVKTAAKEGKEKHLPTITIEGNRITVEVGKDTPHPNTEEHYIAWIDLFGVNQQDRLIFLGRAAFAPGFSHPKAVFTLLSHEWKEFIALSYCNLHGVWEEVVPA